MGNATGLGASVRTSGWLGVGAEARARPSWARGEDGGGAPFGDASEDEDGTLRGASPGAQVIGARELGRLRQLRSLSLHLAQACTVEDLVDVLATRLASDCGAEASVVYLMDPDQADVLRLAAARGLSNRALDPGLLCRDGGALIARAVRRGEPLIECPDTDGLASGLATVVACPLLLRTDAVGAFAFGWSGSFTLDSANHEFLLGASSLVALALDRTAATEKAREAQRVSDYMTTLVGRIFGGEQKTPA